jgi:hypothetical protein
MSLGDGPLPDMFFASLYDDDMSPFIFKDYSLQRTLLEVCRFLWPF